MGYGGNVQCQGQAFLLPVFLLVFCKQNASLQQLLSHMATVCLSTNEARAAQAARNRRGKRHERHEAGVERGTSGNSLINKLISFQLDVTPQVRPSMVPLSPKLWFKAVKNAPCSVYNEAPPVGSRVIAIILRVLVAQINEELLLVLCESQCVFQGMVKDRQGVDWVRRG